MQTRASVMYIASGVWEAYHEPVAHEKRTKNVETLRRVVNYYTDRLILNGSSEING